MYNIPQKIKHPVFSKISSQSPLHAAMLYYLVSLIPDFEETPLRLFNYFTFRAAAALVTATLLGILLGPLTVRLLKDFVAPPRLEGIVAEEFVDHSKDKTPSMGGLLVVASIILATLLWGDLTNRLLLLFLCTLAAFSAIGFIDDFTKVKSKKDGVSAKYKLVCQFAVSIMAILVYSHLTPEIAKTFCQLYVPFIKDPVWIMPYPVAVAFAVFVLVGTSNAVNLTDGKDGLATGCTVWCMMTYALIAYLCTNSIFASHLDLPFIRNGAEIVVFAAAIIGACVGFLWHNCKPASMFMGDTGSLALGGIIGFISILVNQELLLVLVGGVFVMEIGSVIIQVTSFKLTGKRIFKCTPIHHHFEQLGWTETQIVTRFWILAGLFALAGAATMKLR